MTFYDILVSWGLLPDPIFILNRIAASLRESNLYELFRWVGFFIMIGFVGIRLVAATAQLRAQGFVSLLLRAILVGVILQTMPYIQGAIINLYAGGLDAGLEVGNTLMERSLRETDTFNNVLSMGAFVTGMGATAYLGTKVVQASRRIAKEANLRVVDTGLDQGNKQAIDYGRALDYLSAFSILIIFLFILLTGILVSSGIVVLIGTLLFPIAVPFLVFNGPGIVSQQLQPYYRAFVGAFLIAVIVPIIFGMASTIAIGIPGQEFALKWEAHWEALKQTRWWDVGEIARHIGGLLWTIIRTAVQVLIGLYLAWLIINRATDIVLNFIGGIAGLIKSYAETFLQARAIGRALQMGSAARGPITSAAGGAATVAYVGGRMAYATAKNAFLDARAEGKLSPLAPPPPPNAYTTGTRRPQYVRPYDPFAIQDRLNREAAKEGVVRKDIPIVLSPPPASGPAKPPELPPPKEGDENRS